MENHIGWRKGKGGKTMKIVLDYKKANPFQIDQDTWFYASRRGRCIEILRQNKDKSYTRIKLKMSNLEKCLKHYGGKQK